MAEPATRASIVLAAGGIILRPGRAHDEPQTLIIHRPRHDDWSFPKGKLDAGESFEAAALREVHEETALRCTLLDEVTTAERTIDYDQAGALKRTRYWIMAVTGDDGFSPTEEVDACRWVTLEEAAGTVTDPVDRALAEQARSAILG